MRVLTPHATRNLPSGDGLAAPPTNVKVVGTIPKLL